jgi:hypothetical protein
MSLAQAAVSVTSHLNIRHAPAAELIGLLLGARQNNLAIVRALEAQGLKFITIEAHRSDARREERVVRALGISTRLDVWKLSLRSS